MGKENNLLIAMLTIGTFSILNTELGVIGILPLIGDYFNVGISQAGLMVSLFALTVAISGPTMPLLFSRINRKKVLLLVLGVFFMGNIVSALTANFVIALIVRVIQAVFHPVYISLALTLAASSVNQEEAPKAVSRVFIGISAAMVIGVPITTFLASSISIGAAQFYAAAMNAIAFAGILTFVPPMPVKETLSYGAQLRVLRKSIVWLSIVTAVLLNAGVLGVYSYLSEYLEKVTSMSWNTISMMLFLYGAANIIGNSMAGGLLAKNAIKTVVSFPFALGVTYITLTLVGQATVPVAFVISVWGILAGLGGVTIQFWVTSSAPEAPDFANGLFLTSANLGTTMGTTLCGVLITGIGIEYVALGGLFFLLSSMIFTLLRISMVNRQTSPKVGEQVTQ